MRYVPRDQQFHPDSVRVDRRVWMRASLLLVLALTLAQPLFAYELPVITLGSAGGESAGGSYQLGTTLGMSVIGASSASSFDHLAGFWRWSPDPGTSGVESNLEGELPLHTRLTGAMPNPFRRSTEVRFDIAGTDPARVRLQVFDVAGRMVARLVDEDLAPGDYSYSWNGRGRNGESLASGVYFVRFVSDDVSATRRVVLSR